MSDISCHFMWLFGSHRAEIPVSSSVRKPMTVGSPGTPAIPIFSFFIFCVHPFPIMRGLSTAKTLKETLNE